MRTIVISLALAAALAALASAGTVAASSTPDSQAAICQTALDKLTGIENTVVGEFRVGRLHPLFTLGVASRPDEWVLEYERRVTLFQAAFDHSAESCPQFAPYTGPLPGHLHVSPLTGFASQGFFAQGLIASAD